MEKVVTGTVTHLRLFGTIDETFDARGVSEGLSGNVIFDLGAIERISSFGVRQWMQLMGKLPPSVRSSYIVNAAPMIVDQLATVEGFAGPAKVLSVLGPYTCESCGEESVRKIDLRADKAAVLEGRAPEHTCQKCGSLLTFADNPEEMFAFAKAQTLDRVDPAVDSYLSSLSSKPKPTAQHHSKIVEEDLTFIRLSGELRGDLNIRRIASGLQGRVAFDFGGVSALLEGGAEKLVQMLEMAAEEAQVFLWRVPPFVLSALDDKPLPAYVQVATLWLPLSCNHCGEGAPQRIAAHEYLAELKSGTPEPRRCSVCGGPAQAPLRLELKKFLLARTARDAPIGEFEAIETRALSRSLQAVADAAPQELPPAVDEQQSKPARTEQTQPGSKSADNLQIIKRIGSGGMAEVFLAKQSGMQGFEKYIVLKKVLPAFASQPQFVDMLFQEARMSARLTHPNIVQVHDVGMLGPSAYITMEYVRGPDLRQLMVGLRKVGLRLPVEHAVCIVAEIASALHYAHSYVDPMGVAHPLVHRDVSPHNILISMDGAIKLSDLGIAKVIGDREQTQPGMVKGKLDYLPPEVLSGQGADGRGDLFSLGVVLFELLTGKVPFRGANEAATMRALALDDPPDPIKLNPEISKALAAVMKKALAKDPNQRHQSGEQLRDELEEALSAERLHSSPGRVATFFRQALGDSLSEYATAPLPAARLTPAAVATRLTPEPKPVAPPAVDEAPAGDESTVVGDVLGMVGGEALRASNPAPKPSRNDDLPFPVDDDAPPLPPPARAAPMLSAEPLTRRAPLPVSRPSVPALGEEPPTRPGPQQLPRGAKPEPEPASVDDGSHSPFEAIDDDAPAEAPMAEEEGAARSFDFGDGLADAPPPPRASAEDARWAPPLRGRHVEAAAVEQEAPPAARAPVVAAPAPKAKRSGGSKWPYIVVALGLIAAASGFAALRLTAHKPAGMGEAVVQVSNLAPDEHLFVQGVRSESEPSKAAIGAPVLMAVSKQNQLVRFGLVNALPNMDVTTIPELHVALGARAELTVESDPTGCSVEVSGLGSKGTTPFTTFIPAGSEAKVEVSCPGLPKKTYWVLAAPEQKLQVTARMFR